MSSEEALFEQFQKLASHISQ